MRWNAKSSYSGVPRVLNCFARIFYLLWFLVTERHWSNSESTPEIYDHLENKSTLKGHSLYRWKSLLKSMYAAQCSTQAAEDASKLCLCQLLQRVEGQVRKCSESVLCLCFLALRTRFLAHYEPRRVVDDSARSSNIHSS